MTISKFALQSGKSVSNVKLPPKRAINQISEFDEHGSIPRESMVQFVGGINELIRVC